MISNLDSYNNAYGHNEISVRMSKTRRSSVSRPLQVIYTSCLEREKLMFSQYMRKVTNSW